MKKVVYRFYLDYEKEEKWINEMAMQGWHLKKFSLGRFTFTKGEPGAFIYRNEFISGLSSKEKKEYFDLIKDSGIIIINEFGGWVYMKRAAAKGPFELYTDKGSKIDYYQRMLNIFLLLFFINAWMGFSNVSTFFERTKIEFVSTVIGVLNIAAALLIAYPIIKVFKRKKELKGKRQFFE